MNLRERLERAAEVVSPSHRQIALFHGGRVGLALLLAVFTYMLFPASPAVDFPIYEVGSVASDNVIAPFAFRVLKTDDELLKERESLVRAAEPIYQFVPAAMDSTRRQLQALVDAVESAASSADATTIVPAIQRAALMRGITLAPQEAQYLSARSRREALFATVQRVFERWLSLGVTTSGALDNVLGDVVLRTGGAERRVSADSIPTFNMLVARAAHPS